MTENTGTPARRRYTELVEGMRAGLGLPDGQQAAWAMFADKLMVSRAVWALSNGDGLVAARGVDGSSAQPFWSSRDRAEEMVALAGTENLEYYPVEISLDEFVRRSLPELVRSGVLVGLDWEADKKGWVFEAKDILDQLKEIIRQRLN